MEKLEIDEPSFSDKDMFDGDVSEIFQQPYHLSESRAVGLDYSYVLQLASSFCGSTVAAGLSNNTVALYNSADLSVIDKCSLSDQVTGLRFSSDNEKLLYCSTKDGIVLQDFRSPSSKVVEFLQNKEHPHKPILSFDVNSDNKFLAAGTEVTGHDAFILFWDAREPKLLGGYWDSHSDDITTTKFHPTDPNKLATGGTDSQINLFDIDKESEDEALATTLNAESQISSLEWCKDSPSADDYNCLSVLTTNEDAFLWNFVNDSSPSKTYSREDITVAIKRYSTEWTYLASSHFSAKSKKLFVLAGSSYTKSPCLRLLSVNKKKHLKPMSNLPLMNKAHKGKVRCSTMIDKESDEAVFVTGAEDGLVCLWKPGSGSSLTADSKSEHKAKTEKKRKSKAPY